MQTAEIEYAAELVKSGNFPSEIARRVNRKFKCGWTAETVAKLMDDGAIADNRSVSDDDIRAMILDGDSMRDIRRKLGVGFSRISRVRDGRAVARGTKKAPRLHASRRARPEPAKPHDDPVANIGLLLADLPDNACRYPVARDPETRAYRFCGCAQMVRGRDMRGKIVRSSYCVEHHGVCHQEPKPQENAA